VIRKSRALLKEFQRCCPFPAFPNTVCSKYYAPPNISIRRRISDLQVILLY
jgi:hypothetical protein